MPQIAIAGTPGSGKTTFWEILLEREPNFAGALAEFEIPSWPEGFSPVVQTPFKIPVPIRNFMLCAGCALCQKSCPFGAIWEEDLWIDPLICEGCGVCVKNCPNQALQMANMQIGELIEGRIGERKIYTGKIFPGARGTPRLLRGLKEKLPREEVVVWDLPARFGEFLAAALEGVEKIFLFLTPENASSYLLERVSYFSSRAETYFLINRITESSLSLEELRIQGERRGFKFLEEVPELSSSEKLKERFRAILSTFPELAKI